MKWIAKALVQNAVALLPDRHAQPLYFALQTRFGELRKPRFRMRFDGALDIVRMLAPHGGIAGKRILEVGTGRTVDVPMALWLMGAGNIVTLDLNRYLREEIVLAAIEHLSQNWSLYRDEFAAHCDAGELDARYDELVLHTRGRFDLDALLRLLQVDYRAPADASAIDLEADAVDVHLSFVVLQHIPPPALRAIIREGRRVLRDDGYMLHFVNTTDHFSHMDSSLTSVNFLRFSERQWRVIGGNRFMFHNRMRVDDYREMFSSLGLDMVVCDEKVDERALQTLKNGFPLHPDFRRHPPERAAVSHFRALLRPV